MKNATTVKRPRRLRRRLVYRFRTDNFYREKSFYNNFNQISIVVVLIFI